jgi:hypothetical protein
MGNGDKPECFLGLTPLKREQCGIVLKMQNLGVTEMSQSIATHWLVKTCFCQNAVMYNSRRQCFLISLPQANVKLMMSECTRETHYCNQASVIQRTERIMNTCKLCNFL